MEQQAALAAALILYQALALEIPQALRHLKETTAAQGLITFPLFVLVVEAGVLVLRVLPLVEPLALVVMELYQPLVDLPSPMQAAEAVAHHPELLHLAVMEVVVPEVLAREELLELPILVAVVVVLGQAPQVPVQQAALAVQVS
jgi:hypothetical protein